MCLCFDYEYYQVVSYEVLWTLQEERQDTDILNYLDFVHK